MAQIGKGHRPIFVSESNMEPQDRIHVLFTYFSISVEPESGPILERAEPEFGLATQAYWTVQILWYFMWAHAGSGPGGSLIDKDTLKRSKLFLTWPWQSQCPQLLKAINGDEGWAMILFFWKILRHEWFWQDWLHFCMVFMAC